MPDQPLIGQTLCFVLMPFGEKSDASTGPKIHFDSIYQRAIRPGIEDAGMFPIRADEEEFRGIIHKTMYERLLVCDFAVADLTTGNANVLYELGVRHAARPRTTLALHASQRPLPFDVRLMRTERYDLDDDNVLSDESALVLRGKIADVLRTMARVAHRQAAPDSPLFQLIDKWQPAPLDMAEAEAFKEQLARTEALRNQLTDIQVRGRTAASGDRSAADDLAGVRGRVFATTPADVGVWTALLLAHRALGDWSGMIDVCDRMPTELSDQVTVRETLAFALNRRAEKPGDGPGAEVDRSRAQQILEDLRREQGPTAETSGLLGRIHKSRWLEARRDGRPAKARGFLKDAIAAYVEGLEADWREVYPGVNALTLLDAQGGEEALARKERLLPVVRYAAEQRLRGPEPDFWDHATMLEIAVLDDDAAAAQDHLDRALTRIGERWQPGSTAQNLGIIAEVRRARGVDVGWISSFIEELEAESGGPGPDDVDD